MNYHLNGSYAKLVVASTQCKNVFPCIHLRETIYMEQPPRYIDPRSLNRVLSLKESLIRT